MAGVLESAVYNATTALVRLIHATGIDWQAWLGARSARGASWSPPTGHTSGSPAGDWLTERFGAFWLKGRQKLWIQPVCTVGRGQGKGRAQMWLFTPDGFYSVVTADEFGHPLQVRARCDDDLDRLRSSYFPTLGENVHIPGRDYPVRAFTTHKEFADCLTKIAMAIDYDNFKSAVAVRHSSERAHVYGNVWSDCRKIKQNSVRKPPQRVLETEKPFVVDDHRTRPVSRTDEYRGRDLQRDGIWEEDKNSRYGLVVFNDEGQVLLREPANHFGGYVWTFSKGRPNKGEHPVDTALRETLEETGYKPVIIGHIPQTFRGGSVGSANKFYLAYDTERQVDSTAVERNKETWNITWASHEEAVELISQTTDAGRERDFKTLHAAYDEYAKIMSDNG